MSTMTTIKQWQDEFFSLAKRIEEPVVRFAGEQARTVARFVPERPSFMATLPKMTELVDSQLKFQKRVVDEEVRFVRSMLAAMAPVMEKVDATTTPSATRKPAPQPAPKSAKATRPTKRARPMTPALAHEPRRLTHVS